MFTKFFEAHTHMCVCVIMCADCRLKATLAREHAALKQQGDILKKNFKNILKIIKLAHKTRAILSARNAATKHTLTHVYKLIYVLQCVGVFVCVFVCVYCAISPAML